MTIDLSKLRKGDTVVFRCGGKAVVESYRENEFGEYVLEYEDPSVLDIIAVEPAKRESAVEKWLADNGIDDETPCRVYPKTFRNFANAIKQDILDEIKNGGSA